MPGKVYSGVIANAVAVNGLDTERVAINCLLAALNKIKTYRYLKVHAHHMKKRFLISKFVRLSNNSFIDDGTTLSGVLRCLVDTMGLNKLKVCIYD